MPDAGVLATILLIVGLFLLALELMIPSFGMIGILAAVCLLVSAWSAWTAWWNDSPGLFWTYASFWVLGIPSVMGGALFLLQNTSLGDRIVLRGPGDSQNPSKATKRSQLQTLVGQIGTASSLLRPGGIVVVDGARFHAESPGMILDAGSAVEVISVKGNRLVVKAASEEAIAASKAAAERRAQDQNNVEEGEAQAETVASGDAQGSLVAQADSDGEGTGILDFEIPED